MKEDIFIQTRGVGNSSRICPNYKNPIKYLNLDKISTKNFGENFNTQFFEKTNRGGLTLKYVHEEISFEVWPLNSIINVNLDLKYFKIVF